MAGQGIPRTVVNRGGHATPIGLPDTFAGTGVGSGLVFDRRISYGATFRAGEVGHVELNMGDILELGGLTLQPRRCSCGKHGYHFESLIGIGGLGHLAGVLDRDTLTAVMAAYRADGRHEDVVGRLSGDPEKIAGMILLHVLRALGDRALTVVVDDPLLHHFLERLMVLYGQLFAVGIAAILDALDLPYVALCGTIPEYLQGNNAFRRAFIQHLAACVMGTSPQYLYGDMRAWGWRGAALLTRDPSYLKHRFPGLSGSAL
ncbi:ROK family protein [Streptomyces sp. NPDC088350]|uniref:ROK family protein n=1 Tax=Streptomyces sp. NPDC088350 TaxID=3365854 RepID=UPI003802258C